MNFTLMSFELLSDMSVTCWRWCFVLVFQLTHWHMTFPTKLDWRQCRIFIVGCCDIVNEMKVGVVLVDYICVWKGVVTTSFNVGFGGAWYFVGFVQHFPPNRLTPHAGWCAGCYCTHFSYIATKQWLSSMHVSRLCMWGNIIVCHFQCFDLMAMAQRGIVSFSPN